MAELVDAADLKSAGSNTVRVQVPLRPPNIILLLCASTVEPHVVYCVFIVYSPRLPIVNSGSIVSSILSRPISASHSLNGSAFGDGID